MKKILICGKGSYIGGSFASFLSQWKYEYSICELDTLGDSFLKADFTGFDVVFQVAGIAHVKETKENRELYYKVNRDLAYESAIRAKQSGVSQFILLSSMSVYGMDTGIITKETLPCPKTNYGESKLEAEELISSLDDKNFHVCILRPPMVYGSGCKGNFQSLISFAKKLPFFPYVNNRRSMIYIDNLSSFVKLMIDTESGGLFFPQDREYSSTDTLVSELACAFDRNIRITKLFTPLLPLAKLVSGKAKKAFGTLIYKDTDDFDFSYCIADKRDAVRKSAGITDSKDVVV